MTCEVKEEKGQDEYKYLTTCRTSESTFVFAATDIRLARDLGEWVQAGKLKVADLKKEKNELEDNVFVIEIRKRVA
jgi:hypothetical protein